MQTPPGMNTDKNIQHDGEENIFPHYGPTGDKYTNQASKEDFHFQLKKSCKSTFSKSGSRTHKQPQNGSVTQL